MLLREGYSNAKIAEDLFISEGTIKKHISNIFGKLDLYSRTEVLVFVERNIEKFELALNSVDSNHYASWHSALSAEVKMTSGVLDVLFDEDVDEKYSVYLTDESGDNENLIGAEFRTTDKEVEVSFNEGLPIKSLLEGKLLKLDFPLTTAQGSTVNKLNYTKLDMTNTGEVLELKADKAVLAYEGVAYSLGEDEAAFMEPLQFEVYKTLSEDGKDEFGGQIYLKLQLDSAEKILELPVSFSINSEKIQESIDLDFNEGNLVATVGNGVVVTYSCEIPFDVFQGGSKVQESGK